MLKIGVYRCGQCSTFLTFKVPKWSRESYQRGVRMSYRTTMIRVLPWCQARTMANVNERGESFEADLRIYSPDAECV